MADVVVTVPRKLWAEWCAEGDLPGEKWSGNYSYFSVPTCPRRIEPGERVYVVANGRLQGFAPLVRVALETLNCSGRWPEDRYYLVRAGHAEAVTIDEPIKGFQGYRYRWWKLEDERPMDMDRP